MTGHGFTEYFSLDPRMLDGRCEVHFVVDQCGVDDPAAMVLLTRRPGEEWVPYVGTQPRDALEYPQPLTERTRTMGFNLGSFFSKVGSSVSLPSIALAAMGVAMSKSISFRLGNYQVSAADTAGTPVHMTFGEAFTAGEKVMEGQTGSVTIGDVVVTIGTLPAVA